MISKLRFRFIRITMIAILSVLTVIIAVINAVNITSNNQSLDAMTDQLMKTHIAMIEKQIDISAMPEIDFSGFNKAGRFLFQNEKELPYSTRFFTMRLDCDGELVSSNLKRIASVTEKDLEAFRTGILKRSSPVGWYDGYRYRIGETDSGYYLVILEATATKGSMLYVLFLTLAVGLMTFLLLFAVITVFSGRAIRPIVAAYDKQKQFITDASHELKTPLTVISANTEILALTCPENEEWCDGITRQTARMRSLIGQMIQMAKLDEGGTLPESAVFDLTDAVCDTALSFETLAERRNLHLVMELSPAITVTGHEESVRQVIAILMDNAVKYCDESGSIRVSLREKKGGAVLSVANTYKDINTLELDRLFDRFYRNSKAREASGSFGLGLSIARSVMEMHKGSLDCRKAGEDGIEFTAIFRK